MSTPLPFAIDPRLCPLCGQTNQCAMEEARTTGLPQPPCWCTEANFSAELLSRLPETGRGRACVCAACARDV